MAAASIARTFDSLRRTRLTLVGIVILLIVTGGAVLAPLLTPYDPTAVEPIRRLAPPSPLHWLGTDDLGRDQFTRVLYGGRIALQVTGLTTILALLIGLPLGLLAGYGGGWLDLAIMRLMDAILAIPGLVLALAIATVLGPSLGNIVIAIGVVNSPMFANLVRSQVLSLKEFEFVAAARVIGCRDARIMWRHIFPNCLDPIIVQASILLGHVIIAEASLSFLGLGVPPPVPTWGGMLQLGYPRMGQAPWLAIAPGLAIFVTVLGFNFLGDGLRDLLDPRAKGDREASGQRSA